MSSRILFAAAGMVGVLFVVSSGCRGNADFSDVAPTPVTLKAEEFQSEILAIDHLVFAEGPLDPARREALGRRLEALAGRVKATGDAPFLVLESLELRRLGSGSRDLPPDAPKATLQREWMRIRNNLFDDRSWFARSAADLAAPGR
ncbi:MAG: hypothetical protein M3167_15210 [Acidobacteriota bacterium]|nr:hypothetical protein [Acidobacteriota bacterium]